MNNKDIKKRIAVSRSKKRKKICFLATHAYPLFNVRNNGVHGGSELQLYTIAKYFASKDEFDINKCVFPKIEQWVRGFMDAEFVITDSFHGTAFSILFNKPFISIVNESRGASRFYSLLKTFGLENRAITEEGPIDLSFIRENIDFVEVNRILNEEREKSWSFLKEALNE